MFKSLGSLPKTVWLIGLISFVNDTASEMLFPILPLFLTSVLMAGPRALGLIEGIADAASSMLRLASGVFVDKLTRIKPWLLVGYGLASISRPLTILATSWTMVIGIRLADRIGKGLRSSPRDALLAASVDRRQHGLAFGFHRAMDNGGAVLGPILAFLLLQAQVSYENIFLLAIVPAVICIGLVLILPEATLAEQAKPVPLSIDWRYRQLPLPLRRFLIVVGLFSVGNASNIFLLLRAKELGVPEPLIPLLWALVSLVAALLSTPLASLSDRVGRLPLLLVGYAAFGVVYLALGFLDQSTGLLAVLFILYGVFVAATEGVEKAMVADLAPDDRRGTAFGWFNMVVGLALLPASIVFGVLYETLSPAAAFGFSGACAFSACLLLWRWFGRR
ncbi:MAG: MFS transporter [Burkholderiaceae bacterium]